VQTTAHHAPKSGNTEAEYEDAYRVVPVRAEASDTPPGPAGGASTRRSEEGGSPPRPEEGGSRLCSGKGGVRVVVADGASESLLAGRWAGLLTDVFAGAPDAAYDVPERFAATAAEAAAAWPGVVGAYLAEREERGSPLRWYEQPGLARGAFATLLAVAVDDAGWRAAAVGDTCLFHVRDGVLLTAFPLDDPEDFGTAPPLLGSRDLDTALVADRVRLASGELGPGDVLYACTDALAAWVLAADPPPWEKLDEPGFAAWLDAERTAERMTNDDVTLVRVAPR
jgi:hypothetical protein